MGGAASTDGRYDHSNSIDESPSNNIDEFHRNKNADNANNRQSGGSNSANSNSNSSNNGQEKIIIEDEAYYKSLTHVKSNRIVVPIIRRHPFSDYRFGKKIGE